MVLECWITILVPCQYHRTSSMAGVTGIGCVFVVLANALTLSRMSSYTTSFSFDVLYISFIILHSIKSHIIFISCDV